MDIEVKPGEKITITGYICEAGLIGLTDQGHGLFGGYQLSCHLCHPDYRERCELLRAEYRGKGCVPVTITIDAGQPTTLEEVERMEREHPEVDRLDDLEQEGRGDASWAVFAP